MKKLFIGLTRNENGLYDLTIITEDGRVELDVRGIRQKRAMSLIEETVQKVDE